MRFAEYETTARSREITAGDSNVNNDTDRFTVSGKIFEIVDGCLLAQGDSLQIATCIYKLLS